MTEVGHHRRVVQVLTDPRRKNGYRHIKIVSGAHQPAARDIARRPQFGVGPVDLPTTIDLQMELANRQSDDARNYAAESTSWPAAKLAWTPTGIDCV